MPTLEEQFWARVITGPSCWRWTGQVAGRDRRPRLEYREHPVRHKVYAHRLSWELHFGPIPEGMKVCHRCDNPECTNPAHLFLGTQSENIRDRTLKGRSWRPVGTVNPRAKLDADDVTVIRVLLEAGVSTQYKLAGLYGVSRSTIKDIQHGRSWADVA